MVHGLATADIQAVTADRGAYTAFLSVKGRMVADARAFLRPGAGAAPELLLTTDPSALPGLLEHLRKFIPPLFARFEDVSGAWSAVGVFGDGASEAARAGLAAAGAEADRTGAAGDPDRAAGLESVRPDVPEETVVEGRGPAPSLAIRVAETGGDGWELLVPAARADAVVAAAVEAGGREAPEADLEPLRIAAGRPRWGAELTPEVIPLEAGLERAISQTKGCYTGQEVIVRILHRGHVNRHLRALTFGDEAPAPGAALFEPGNEKARGVVTSVAGGVGLGYVRREIEPPAELRAGSPDGPSVRVTEVAAAAARG